ncbi:YncE family protein [Edaphobacter modestus]|uniref:DNA-binding beta-propeller fold protein YncE n=1 Tax=Edaphobacter modestus TaxID=388466 RepID=A0A4Q7YZX6_9BACT|nr:YncE family protein [Edaphobacter modestus]RZU43552.1 DNA-binding beta-propeller fold protein YncE [Edaphobacter modestus]
MISKSYVLAAALTLFAASTHAQSPSTQSPSPREALLVVTKQSHALAIVDALSLRVLAHVPIGEDPHEVVVGPDHRTAFISNYGEGTLHTLARVDLVNQKPLPPVDLSPLVGAHGIFLHDGSLWVTTEGSKSLAVINPATSRVTSVLGTGQDKTHLVWVSPDGKKIVASNAGSRTMSIFDQVEIKPTVVPGAPAPPASYTHAGWHHTLIPVGEAAEGFAVSPDARELWVGNADGTISLINLVTEKVQDILHPGIVGANRLKFTPDGRLVIVTTHTGKDLVIIDSRNHAVVKRIPIEQRGASGIQIEPNGKRAFIACPRDHYVAVVDLTKLEMIGRIDAGREPDGLAWWTY